MTTELLSQFLQKLTASEALPLSAIEQLAAWALADELRAKAFGITPANVSEAIGLRSHLFHTIYPDLIKFCQNKGIKQHPALLETLWNLWLPLAMQLASHRQQLQRPMIQGILGGQGTGKTTLAAILTLILKHLGYRTLSLSLDDLYKTYPERLALQQQDPRLIWRGPPGTHDVELGIKVLDQLRRGLQENYQLPITNYQSIEVPRFDKSAWGGAGDRTQPEIVENIDIVLFEGWFVGVRPIDPGAFDNAPPPILTADDRRFARDANAKLQDYLPLWQRLDGLILLLPTDYRLSQQWRRQAEQQMISTGKSGMSDETVDRFVEYFWKSIHPELFIRPMARNSDWVDLVIEINWDREIGLVYKPSDRLP
ncbi:MAG TPA: glycerate kinase [Cyanobacteria bacterium UBA11369]|nr:glycerate kinase [Cyanobacteria bacterium UBA11371]HBE32385.1 glycerate kinase [Cyanobacteria bacterium UBA11368]HBE47559.1 glycerate kinase [Cyanobacteria bacterium UBA11369]